MTTFRDPTGNLVFNKVTVSHAVWHVAPSFWNHMLFNSKSSIWWKRLAFPIYCDSSTSFIFKDCSTTPKFIPNNIFSSTFEVLNWVKLMFYAQGVSKSAAYSNSFGLPFLNLGKQPELALSFPHPRMKYCSHNKYKMGHQLRFIRSQLSGFRAFRSFHSIPGGRPLLR